MLTSGIALLLICAVFVAYDRITLKNMMIRKLDILADIIGENSTAALTFDREDDAKKTLSALKAEQHIVSACIYTIDGKVFTKYHRENINADFTPPMPEKNGYHFTKDYLIVFRDIKI